MKTSKLVVVVALAILGNLAHGQAKKRADDELPFPDAMAKLEAEQALLRKRGEVQKQRQEDAAREFGAGLPRVMAIYGFDGKLTAKLQLADGSLRTFNNKEAISDTLRIAGISPSGVYVSFRERKEFVMLPFASPSDVPGRGPAGQNGQQNLPQALLPDLPAVPMPKAAAIPVERAK